MSKERFLMLFPFAGIWGDKVFSVFDTNYSGQITLSQFIIGISHFCKSSQKQQIKILFKMYDLNEEGYIEEDELV